MRSKKSSYSKNNKNSSFRKRKEQKPIAQPDESKPLLNLRNPRRFVRMSLMAPFYGFKVSCSLEDAKNSNTMFYNDYTEFISVSNCEPCDEIDRQQMELQNPHRAEVASAYIRALQIVAADMVHKISSIPASTLRIPLMCDGLQLTLNGDLVCTLVFNHRPKKKSLDSDLIKKKDEGRTSSLVDKRDFLDGKHLRTLRNSSTVDRLRRSRRTKNVSHRKDTRLGLFDSCSSRLDAYSDTHIGNNHESLEMRTGGCTIRKSIRPIIVDDDREISTTFGRCRNLIITEVDVGAPIIGTHTTLCPCCTVYGQTITLRELRMIKYCTE